MSATLTAGTLDLSAALSCQMAVASQHHLALSVLTAAQQWQTLFRANSMSTSHYSRPYQGPTPPPNTKRHSLLCCAGFWALAMVDILALAGASDIVEALTFAGLTLLNVAILIRLTK